MKPGATQAGADHAGAAPGGGAPAAPLTPALGLKPWFWHVIYAFSGPLLHLKLRVVVRQHGALPTGAVLIAAKHTSSWDIPLMTWLARSRLGQRTYMLMGSFIGYAVLGRIVPPMRWCGGVPVMRPKEVLRLRKQPGMDRAKLHALMDRVNGVAEATRREIFRRGGVLVFFPEGSRDATQVLPVRSEHELASAVAAAAEGAPVMVWPVSVSYGPPRWLRRLVWVDLLPPVAAASLSATAHAAAVGAALTSAWVPPQSVR